MRIVISEWQWAFDAIGQYAAARGISLSESESAFRRLGEKVQQSLHLKKSPIEIASGGVRAKGVAGLVGLDENFEIEIVPKYALPDSAHWRQDLLFITMVSKHGNLLLQNQIRASTAATNDLASLVAQVLLRLFYANRRTPLKTYHLVRYRDFELDGEFDAEDLLLPDSEGFEQHRYQFDTNNEFSATLKASVDVLCKKVREPALLNQLRRMAGDIGQITATPSKVRRRVPARLRRWQSLYDLAFDVIRGFGLAPGNSHHQMPGFVVNTWQMWQDLVARALMQAFGASAVNTQLGHPLGISLRNGKSTNIKVVPDAVLVDQSPALIVDAKYKGRAEDGPEGIKDTDFYEAMAFMQGVASNQAILVYPAINAKPKMTGDTEVVEYLKLLNGQQIWALGLEVNGISGAGGFTSFVQGLAQQIVTLTRSPMVPTLP